MGKTLIIYFSRADENYAVGYIEKGNTEIVAEYVQELIGADVFRVEPSVPYSKDYMTCIKEAKQRIGHAPIKKKLTDISSYDTIFVMSPIYWGTYAPEIETAIKDLDFKGQTIWAVSTHEGSGLGSMIPDLSRVCKNANVKSEGLAIKGTDARNARQVVEAWLVKNQIIF